MGDRAKGLHEKFQVVRTDGKSEPGEKHFGCEYFVLDMDHDPFAEAALLAYAKACRSEYPLLASDLLARLHPDGCHQAEDGTCEICNLYDVLNVVPEVIHDDSTASACPCTIPQTDHCCDRTYHQGCIVFCACEAKIHPEWQKREGMRQVKCANLYHG